MRLIQWVVLCQKWSKLSIVIPVVKVPFYEPPVRLVFKRLTCPKRRSIQDKRVVHLLIENHLADRHLVDYSTKIQGSQLCQTNIVITCRPKNVYRPSVCWRKVLSVKCKLEKCLSTKCFSIKWRGTDKITKNRNRRLISGAGVELHHKTFYGRN
jgi:hypothetical protein